MLSGNRQQPINVAILIYNDVEALDLAGPFEVFSAASQILPLTAMQGAGFQVFTVAQTEKTIASFGGLELQPAYTFADCPPIDILLVPGGHDIDKELENPALLAWLKSMFERVAWVVGIGTGVLLLAHAGLLDGMHATTHYTSLRRLQDTFPRVKVLKGHRFVDNGKVLTSGGAIAGIDLTLHLVRRLYGKELADRIATRLHYVWDGWLGETAVLPTLSEIA
ncbi:MAG: DJ-1/PfpI family protein [Chloroflexi bacterium]|nr:DJ-1/PfpI family protein [Chloroflexota bacterium]